MFYKSETDLAVFCSVFPARRSSWEPVAVATWARLGLGRLLLAFGI